MSFVFSCLRSFVLLIALLDNVVFSNVSFRPPNSTCVWTEQQLRKVIEEASKETRTRITLCRQNISISSIRNQYNLTGIDVTDRFVDIRCNLKRSKGMCKFDGGYFSRIFYGERADLTVSNVLFTNARPDDCDYGGAIYVYDSNLTLTGCSFIGNLNKCGSKGIGNGGAITVEQSTLKINGGSKNSPVIFSENVGNNGAALYGRFSEVSTDGYTVFISNLADSGTVSFYESTFKSKNVKFVDNSGFITSALDCYNSNSALNNVEFIGNDGGDEIILNYNSSLKALNCTFKNHKSRVFKARDSKITLKNSIFSNNTSNETGSNIYIEDDKDPLKDGTFVKCASNVVFCDGVDEASIDEDSYDNSFGDFRNTNCKTKRAQGTPGQGSCPI